MRSLLCLRPRRGGQTEQRCSTHPQLRLIPPYRQPDEVPPILDEDRLRQASFGRTRPVSRRRWRSRGVSAPTSRWGGGDGHWCVCPIGPSRGVPHRHRGGGMSEILLAMGLWTGHLPPSARRSGGKSRIEPLEPPGHLYVQLCSECGRIPETPSYARRSAIRSDQSSSGCTATARLRTSGRGAQARGS
jgi:hypothetical protein